MRTAKESAATAPSEAELRALRSSETSEHTCRKWDVISLFDPESFPASRAACHGRLFAFTARLAITA